LIAQRDLRMLRNDGVDIHLGQRLPFILNLTAGDDIQARQQRLGLFTAVGLDDTNNNVIAVFFASLGLLEHLVGFAYAWCSSYEDSELANAAFLTSRSFEERLRRGSTFVAPLFCHHRSDFKRMPLAPSGTVLLAGIQQRISDVIPRADQAPD